MPDLFSPLHTSLINIIMKKNMGGIDRIIRIIVAAVIGYLFYSGTLSFDSAWGIVAAIVGSVFLVTALVSSCPLYSLVGLRTSKMK